MNGDIRLQANRNRIELVLEELVHGLLLIVHHRHHLVRVSARMLPPYHLPRVIDLVVIVVIFLGLKSRGRSVPTAGLSPVVRSAALHLKLILDLKLSPVVLLHEHRLLVLLLGHLRCQLLMELHLLLHIRRRVVYDLFVRRASHELLLVSLLLLRLRVHGLGRHHHGHLLCHLLLLSHDVELGLELCELCIDLLWIHPLELSLLDEALLAHHELLDLGLLLALLLRHHHALGLLPILQFSLLKDELSELFLSHGEYLVEPPKHKALEEFVRDREDGRPMRLYLSVLAVEYIVGGQTSPT